MDKKRRSMPSSPPRSTRTRTTKGSSCVSDIVTRTFDLITSREVIPYYVLAAIFSFYFAPTAHEVPGPRGLDHVVFKILPVIYLMELVRHPRQPVCPLHDHARSYIMFGLLLSSIGDGVLAWQPEYLAHWACFSCLGYLCYTIAFYQYYQASKWSKVVFPIALLVVAVLIYHIGDVMSSLMVLVYVAFLTTLAFFALTRLEVCRNGPAYLGWAGVKLFSLSDLLLAVNMLIPDLGHPVSDTVVAATYFLGQLGIALSTYTIDTACSGDHASASEQSSLSSSASPKSFRPSRNVSAK